MRSSWSEKAYLRCGNHAGELLVAGLRGGCRGPLLPVVEAAGDPEQRGRLGLREREHAEEEAHLEPRDSHPGQAPGGEGDDGGWVERRERGRVGNHLKDGVESRRRSAAMRENEIQKEGDERDE